MSEFLGWEVSLSVQSLLTQVMDFVYCCWEQGGSTIGNPGAETKHSKLYFEKTDLRVVLGQPRVTCSNGVRRV